MELVRGLPPPWSSASPLHRLSKPVKIWDLSSSTSSSTSSTSSGDDVFGASACGASSSSSSSVVVRHPSDVTFLGPFRFAVADSVGHRIVLEDLSTGVSSVIANEDIWPNCIAVTNDDKIIATDRRKKVIKTYDPRGDLLSVWDPGEDVLQHPHGIAVTSKGETVVTDTGASRVYVFTGDGRIARHFGSRGDLLQQLHLPFYVTVDPDDVLLVSDNMNYCVKSFDTSGNYLRKVGSGNNFGQRQFQCPYGVCVEARSREMYVADCQSNRVFAFGRDGRFLRYLLTSTADGCQRPCGVAVGPCGTLVVTELGREGPSGAGGDGGSAAPERGNVKAYSLYESVDANHNDTCRHGQMNRNESEA